MLRVLLILLALFASAPAVAQSPAMPACHDVAPAARTSPAEQHRRPEAAPAHVCVGCIPVEDWLAPRVAASAALPQPAPIARVVTLSLGDAAPPPHRPPRFG